MYRSLLALSASLLLLAGAPAGAHEASPQAQAMTDVAPEAAGAAVAVDAFHAALEAGDSAAALAMLASDVMIFEEGGAERSREEYASHHLEADAAFAAASESALTRRSGWAEGDVAWIASEGRTTGQASDRLTVETMVLKRTGADWRIHHIHWSSRAVA